MRRWRRRCACPPARSSSSKTASMPSATRPRSTMRSTVPKSRAGSKSRKKGASSRNNVRSLVANDCERMTTMNLARHFAERITALRYEDLPPEAVYWSKVAVLDTLGVMLAGSREEAPHIVEDVLGLPAGGGPCLIVGSERRAGALDAALVNGTAAHVLDFDNTAAHMGGHVAAVMVPALLAAAEAFGASGRDLLLGHVAGYEVGARIGQSVNFYHTEKGWHPTWTIGVFAVTAACARMLNLSVGQTETALALATSLAGGTKANFGTM